MVLVEVLEDERPLADIRTWGPNCWQFLNAIAYAYPANPTPTQKQEMQRFLGALAFILPCPMCREHLKRYISDTLTPDVFAGQLSLMKWINDVHNDVNRRTNKPQVSFSEMMLLCEKGCRTTAPYKCTTKKLKTLTILVLVFALLYLIITRRR